MLKYSEIKYQLTIISTFSIIFFIGFLLFPNSKKNNVQFEKLKQDFETQNLDINATTDRILYQEAKDDFYKKSNLSEKDKIDIEEVYQLGIEKKISGFDTGSTESFYSNLIFSFFNFILLYSLISFLIFYLSQSFALLKLNLISKNKYLVLPNLIQLLLKFNLYSYPRKLIISKKVVMLIGKIFFVIISLGLLFSPVYIIGYSLNLKSSQVNILIALILGLISNGLLITSVNNFYQLLLGEKAKGYILTAKMKNVKMLFEKNSDIKVKDLFVLKKNFAGNVLNQIFINADLMFTRNYKNISRLIVTSIVIIELTLNQQNGFFYLMLKSILFNEFRVLLVVIYLTFLVVKISDIILDFIYIKKSERYENF